MLLSLTEQIHPNQHGIIIARPAQTNSSPIVPPDIFMNFKLIYRFCILVLLSLSSRPHFKAQELSGRELKPALQRALVKIPNSSHARDASIRGKRAMTEGAPAEIKRDRPVAKPKSLITNPDDKDTSKVQLAGNSRTAGVIRPATPLSWVLHTSILSTQSAQGSNEQFVDRNGDLQADENTTFDSRGGSFDVAVGLSGTRYEVFSAIDDQGTNNPNDDRAIGVLVVANDTNADFQSDSSNTYNLYRNFRLPSAVAVVSGTSKGGREFVIVSSSGYYNSNNSNDPDNEPTAGVVLFIRDPLTGGFDNSQSRELVRVGDQQLNNANALTLLPNNDLLIADFDSNNLRIVRDTNGDGIPDTLDARPWYEFRFSDDAPLDIAANSRGVVFSHSYGASTIMLALYDDNNDGHADRDETVVEGLSLDNNLTLHGLTVDREGNVYVIEDAMGTADTVSSGGNGGTPRISVFPDPALNGFLRDGEVFTSLPDKSTNALSGLAFGVDLFFAPVGHLDFVNSAALRSEATSDGLGSIIGTNLTLGATGKSPSDATTQGVSVFIEGREAPVLNFTSTQINVYVPKEIQAGTRSVVVRLNGNVTAAEDVSIKDANPALFTATKKGSSDVIAQTVTNQSYTAGPFVKSNEAQPVVVALFGTGLRKPLPVSVTIGGQSATVQYAGPTQSFSGLDQINVVLPVNLSGSVPVIVTTANGIKSRSDVTITIK